MITSLSDPIKERIPRLLESVTFGEDVQWEANVQLQPTPQGMVPMVGVILIIPSGLLGQEIVGAAIMPLGMAQGDETLMDHLRAMWENLIAQRSQMLANPQAPPGPGGLYLPPNGNHPS
jgi:hypothetical protein